MSRLLLFIGLGFSWIAGSAQCPKELIRIDFNSPFSEVLDNLMLDSSVIMKIDTSDEYTRYIKYQAEEFDSICVIFYKGKLSRTFFYFSSVETFNILEKCVSKQYKVKDRNIRENKSEVNIETSILFKRKNIIARLEKNCRISSSKCSFYFLIGNKKNIPHI